MQESQNTEHEHGEHHEDVIHLPAPTQWPIVMAFGTTLILAGIVTSVYLSILGVVLALLGTIGWFRDVLPHEQHEFLPVETEDIIIRSTRTSVERLQVEQAGRPEMPVETYPVLSGLKGGIAGGFAMIIPALAYGLLRAHSIWYPVNLLGGAGVAGWTNTSTANIAAFHWSGLIAAIMIHAVTCLLVGLLYGAMLPMLPRHPVLLGGILAPLLWTGLLHATLGILSPVFDQRIEWGWFLISQIAFGLVAGWVVSRDHRVHTDHSLPWAVRLGLHSPGISHPEDGEDRH